MSKMSEADIKKFMNQMAYETCAEMDEKIISELDIYYKDNPPWCIKITEEYEIEFLEGESLQEGFFRWFHEYRMNYIENNQK